MPSRDLLPLLTPFFHFLIPLSSGVPVTHKPSTTQQNKLFSLPVLWRMRVDRSNLPEWWQRTPEKLKVLCSPNAQTRSPRILNPSLPLFFYIQVTSWHRYALPDLSHDPHSQLSLLRQSPGHITAFLGHGIVLLTGCPAFYLTTPSPKSGLNYDAKSEKLIWVCKINSVFMIAHNASISQSLYTQLISVCGVGEGGRQSNSWAWVVY
jgi:hypothetical protein